MWQGIVANGYDLLRPRLTRISRLDALMKVEGLCDPGDRHGHDHQDHGGHDRDEEPRARSLRLSSQPHIYPVPQDGVSPGLTKGGITRGFLGR